MLWKKRWADASFPSVMTKWKKWQVYFLPARQILEKKVSANKELQVMEQY